MKVARIAVIAALAAAATAAAAQEKPPVAIFQFGNSSCEAWYQSSGNEFARTSYYSWFRGFASGYNYANPREQIAPAKWPSEEKLYRHVDKFCKENPRQPFTAAVFRLVEELKPGATKPKEPKK